MYGVFATIFNDEEKVQLQSLWRGQYIFLMIMNCPICTPWPKCKNYVVWPTF